MSTSNTSLYILEKRLYEKDSIFKKFQFLSEEDIEKVDKDIESRFLSKGLSGLALYNAILEYLTFSGIGAYIPDYDVRLLYLIRAVDKNLVSLSTYLNIDIPSLNGVDGENSDMVKSIREHNLALLRSRIRKELGFYAPKLVSYELAFFKKFICDKELMCCGNKSHFNKLMTGYLGKIDFMGISKEDEDRLRDIVTWYKGKMDGNIDANVVAFNILNQNNLLNLKNFTEQLAFFISIVDEDLRLLTIYEEESRMPEVKRRSLEEVGFYSENLINLEKAYHIRFNPDKKLSFWSI